MSNLDAVLQVRVRQEEKEALEADAEEANIKLSVVLRARILQDPALLQPPVPAETTQDKANKAKVREAVESEEPYGVKIEPSTLQPDRAKTAMQDAERDSWIASTARILMMEKGLSKVAATMQATKEWEASND